MRVTYVVIQLQYHMIHLLDESTYAVIQLQYHMIRLLDDSNLRGHAAPVSHDTPA